MNSVIVYGGLGALGSSVVEKFSAELKWKVYVIDLELASNQQTQVKQNDTGADVTQILITNSSSLIEQATQVEEKLKQKLNHCSKVKAIICAAGGWAGGNASSTDFVSNTNAMIQQSVWPTVICAQLCAKFLDNEGLFVLFGAKAALGPTPSMIGYGLAKAATHQLIKSLADAPNSGLPANACCLAVLPETLDTPNNRKWMPNADFSKWTSLDYLSALLSNWATNVDCRPPSGSLIALNAQTFTRA